MQEIQNYIKAKQIELGHGTLFNHLRKRLPLQQTMGFAPHLAFWVMTFQDVLRLNETLTKDPSLRDFAHHHRQEDAGHEKWFLQDVNFMFDADKLTIAWLYGPTCAAIRDGSYAIIAELLKAESDRLRIVLLLALESTSQVFSKAITEYICEMGYGEKLKYFSKAHYEAENEHAIYEEEGEQKLLTVKLTPQEKEKAIALVDRIYATCHMMADAVMEYVDDKSMLTYSSELYPSESDIIKTVKYA